jgi:hypothetical protein
MSNTELLDIIILKVEQHLRLTIKIFIMAEMQYWLKFAIQEAMMTSLLVPVKIVIGKKMNII